MAEQLFQVGIKGLIRDGEGKVLLLGLPQGDGNEAYWDLPGGRMEAGETFVDTLRRELREEIGIEYTGEPKFLSTVLSNITIAVGDERVPLILMAYEVSLPEGTAIVLGEDEPEEAFDWFTPVEAAKRLARKYPVEFCESVAQL